VGSGISASRGYELVAIQQQADQMEQENERLKIEIAKLKSPDRIKSIAQDQLGMSVPKQTYFSSEK
jgi:cell division protein FtsL